MQQAEGRVRSKSLLEEMSLIGFIPYTDYYTHHLVLSSVYINDHLYVAPYLVKFSKDTPVYPYFKTITKATEKQYTVNGQLYIDPILDEIPSSVLQSNHVKLPLDGNQLLRLMGKNWDKKDMLSFNFLFFFPEKDVKSEQKCNVPSLSSAIIEAIAYLFTPLAFRRGAGGEASYPLLDLFLFRMHLVTVDAKALLDVCTRECSLHILNAIP